ncbi:hypothetical protein N474_09360 [Pseudoalteromonas luteoviolacea CPMOR-2]|uniref:hypothetical protein n=1 Tax=Pseudoalteromonas luteoviolacea TaxID=43657 RepID=UPI0007B0A502|nr:hypothetical protein [Pseudoalteromonas luteoviolacea]KZN56817.1 hypothetical protein N474_09360 [Pseudoalteromonas luteoviolacea CPMOR-2]
MRLLNQYLTKSQQQTAFRLPLVAFTIAALSACSSSNLTSASTNKLNKTAQCIGEIEQHNGLVLLPNAQVPSGVIQPADKGGLCKGQVFVASKDITIWRAWNSEYSGSKLGKWWTFDKPLGSISQYRRENVICPSYSPLDMLVSCTLKAGSQVVIGPGQSAKCSDYFTYPASKMNQLYLADAKSAVINCQTYDGRFSWQTQPQISVQDTNSL